MVVGVTKATGEVCLDDGEHGHEHHETVLGASPEGKRSVLPTPINIRIAVKG